MAYGSISYPHGSGSQTVLTFAYPPTKIPAYDIQVQRHDNWGAGGALDSIVENIQSFHPLDMQWIVAGADAQNWATFLTSCGLPGQYFDYTDPSNVTTVCSLEDGEIVEDYKHPGMYRLRATFRDKI